MLLFYITNYFNTNESGLILLIISVISFLTSFSRFGQDQLIVKYNNSFTGNNSLNNSFTIVLAVSILVVSLTMLLLNLNILFNDKNIFSWVFISVIPLSCTWILVGYFRSNNLQFLANFSENGAFQFLLILSLFFLPKTELYLYGSYVALGFSSFVLLLFLSYINFNLNLKISFKKCYQNLKLGFRIMTSSLLSFLILNSPIYIAGFINSVNDITLYNVCLKVSLIINIGVAIFNSFYSPKYSKLYSNNDFLSLKKEYDNARYELIIFSLIPLISVLIFSNFILGVFSLECNANNISILRCFVLCQFLCVSTGTTGVFLNIVDKESILQRNTLIGLSVSLLFSVSFIYISNVYAMFGMFALGVLLENFLSYFSVKKFFNEKI